MIITVALVGGRNANYFKCFGVKLMVTVVYGLLLYCV